MENAGAGTDDEEFLVTRKRAISDDGNVKVEIVLASILNADATDLFDLDYPMRTASEREVDGVTVGDNDPAEATDDGEDMVQVVARAVSTDVDDGMTITNGTLEGEFLVNNDEDINADLVYSYDSDDIFIDSTGDEGVEITMDSFITKIKDGGTIEVVAYDADGTSIFRLTAN